jgi:histidinol-phosphate aminotransferase
VPLPKPQPGILDIIPYKGGEAKVEGVTKVAKLSSNESPLGPSAKAVAAYMALAAEMHRYPDGGHGHLRDALAAVWGIPADRIVIGNGSDELIGLLVRAFAGPGDEVLFSRHGFLMYAISARTAGAEPVMAPEIDYRTDIEALLAAVSPRTRIVFVTNPNNPTGSYVTAAELRSLRDRLPADVLLVVDAAYAEYVSRNDYSAGMELVEATDNTVVLRTFSKIYGLGGMRVGWAYGPDAFVDVMNRMRGPFNVNAPAQAAAVAALADVDWVEAARRHNDKWLPRLAEGVARVGLSSLPSVGNFMLIRFPEGPHNAATAFRFLQRRGLILRPVAGYGLPDFLRLSLGTDEENEAVLAALADFMAAHPDTLVDPAALA